MLVALVVTQLSQDQPPAPVARIDEVRAVGKLFHVDVAVHNRRDLTAANVQVRAELTIEGSIMDGDQTIDFLSGGQDQTVTFVFSEDPTVGELQTTVTGYAVP